MQAYASQHRLKWICLEVNAAAGRPREELDQSFGCRPSWWRPGQFRSSLNSTGNKRKRRLLAGWKEAGDECCLWGMLSELPEPGPAFQSLGSIEGGVDLATSCKKGAQRYVQEQSWSEARLRGETRCEAARVLYQQAGNGERAERPACGPVHDALQVQTLSVY